MPRKRHMLFVILLLELRNSFVYSHAAGKLALTHQREPMKEKLKINWQELKASAPARDQTKCNAAWAYSAVGAIEGQLWQWFPNYTGRELSVQQLIDCDLSNDGCYGGYMTKAYSYLISDHVGLMFLKDYKTTGTAGECNYDKNAETIPLFGYTKVPQNENEMKEYLKFGPLAAALDSAAMKNYKGGIVDVNKCPTNRRKLDHAVVIIGYDEEVYTSTNDSTPYWILKNSWGVKWGENGTMRLIFGKNACGIVEDVSVPILQHAISKT